MFCRFTTVTSLSTPLAAAAARRTGPTFTSTSTASLVALRGGSTSAGADDGSSGDPNYATLDTPAPGSPFHYTFPVHDLDLAKKFYGHVLGCAEGSSSKKWQDYSLHGHHQKLARLFTTWPPNHLPLGWKRLLMPRLLQSCRWG
jgi:hypothetical protein